MASSDSANAECRALRRHFASLTKAITDPLGLSIELFSEEIIEEVIMEKVKLPNQTDREKNSVLLSAVMRRVETRPSLFNRFMELLKEHGDCTLRELGGKLETTYSELHVPINGELSVQQRTVLLGMYYEYTNEKYHTYHINNQIMISHVICT